MHFLALLWYFQLLPRINELRHAINLREQSNPFLVRLKLCTLCCISMKFPKLCRPYRLYTPGILHSIILQILLSPFSLSLIFLPQPLHSMLDFLGKKVFALLGSFPQGRTRLPPKLHCRFLFGERFRLALSKKLTLRIFVPQQFIVFKRLFLRSKLF